MAYVKIDDGFHDHPRVQECSLAAVGLWTLALSWCRRHLTDGRIGAASVQRLCSDRARLRAARELVECGLWIAEDDGFRFRDYLEHNDSKEEIMQARQRDRERKRLTRGGGSVPLSARTPGGHQADGARIPFANPTQPNPTQPISKDPTDPLSDFASDGACDQLELTPGEPARDLVREIWEFFLQKRKEAFPRSQRLELTGTRRSQIAARLKGRAPKDVGRVVKKFFDPQYVWASKGFNMPEHLFRSGPQYEKVQEAAPWQGSTRGGNGKPAAPAPAYHKVWTPPPAVAELTKAIGKGGQG